ncbi:MAG TPA: GspE/PulE family protein [Rhizomicrobium sp.]|nr:GspE/PulE family protein [Rhizomicrobium sp.]
MEQVVLARGLIGREALARASLVQRETGEKLEAILTRLGLIADDALAQAIADAAGLRVASADDYPAEALFGRELSARFLLDSKALPLRRTPAGVEVALVNPLDTYPAAAIAFALKTRVIPVVARMTEIDAALNRLFGSDEENAAVENGEADALDLERLKDLASDAPVVRAINAIIAQAVEAQASDIHIEPSEDRVRVRFRTDGSLQDQESLPPHLRQSIISRLKVMAGLNIAERRLPQDGRLRHAVRGREYDFRLATSPTLYGETAVLRILDRSSLTLDFAALGFDEAILPEFMKVLKRPNGVMLVTGPTGSGKTTTLYAALATLNTDDRKILTIEDPIEYRMTGINQTQVKPQIGLDFAAALRSFLRQDPDVMMVGEIRDLETAQVAIQAALTGHTILSTLHTNSAATAVTRLLDMGVEPFLIASTVNGVLAQRLVRGLCPHCRAAYHPAEELAELADVSAADTFFRPAGCERCDGTGFDGRIAVMEFLTMTDEIARLVISRAEARDIARAAVGQGMRTMREDAIAKARAGVTTLEEVLRVTQED